MNSKDNLNGFKAYLKQKENNAASTIDQKIIQITFFFNWMETENLHLSEIRYTDLLSFIDYKREKGKSKKQINHALRSVRNYYEYQKKEGKLKINPASNLHLKEKRKRLPPAAIDYRLLENIYKWYPCKTLRQKRNKVILSLLIYQGLSTEDLQAIEPGNIDLKKGKIRIKGNRRRNSRNLELKPFQILEIHEYLKTTRIKIQKEIYKPKPARKPDNINHQEIKDRLFISINGSENIKNSLHHLFKEIKEIYPEIQNVKQIRASVISYWLKNYNLREVQYMAGHKYVSSTERYQLGNIDQLQDKIEKLHPLSNGAFEFGGHNL